MSHDRDPVRVVADLLRDEYGHLIHPPIEDAYWTRFAAKILRAARRRNEMAPANTVGMTELRKEAIRIVEESRRTHIRWRNFLLRNPDHVTKTEHCDVGDLTHHRECIQGYNLVLAVLRSSTWPDQSAQHAVLLEQIKDARREAFREAVEALREGVPGPREADGTHLAQRFDDAADWLERRLSEGEDDGR